LRSRDIKSLYEIISNFFAAGFVLGSLSYTPSTCVNLIIESQFVSKALTTHPVSVVKNGVQVPLLQITTLSSETDFLAFIAVYFSKNSTQRASITTDSTPTFAKKFFKLSALNTVESMLILCESAASNHEAISFDPL
jgi:hypothetical protein